VLGNGASSSEGDPAREHLIDRPTYGPIAMGFDGKWTTANPLTCTGVRAHGTDHQRGGGEACAARLKIATGEAKGKIAQLQPSNLDPRCHVLQLADDLKSIATVVNYAIHPRCWGVAAICSPDLVGPLYDRLAEKGGGGSVHEQCKADGDRG
jgi:hypothetical protein